MARPVVTCLCPTFGRFESLQDAVACFLLQDYPEKRLLIVNDSPQVIRLFSGPAFWGHQWRPHMGLRMANKLQRFGTLGHKRQFLLEDAGSPLVAHWDDDDLYLPWHLSMLVDALQASGKACVKPGAAWYGVGPRDGWKNRGKPHHNVFEGQMLFDREAALALGGYPPLDSGQAKALLAKFGRAGDCYKWNPADAEVSYVYRWSDGNDHVSSRRGKPSRDADFGDGRPIIPDGVDVLAWARERVVHQFEKLSEWRGVGQCSAFGAGLGPVPPGL